MKKRLLSLFLAVCLMAVLFAGTVPTAAAATADKVAGYLMLHEVMDGEQFAALMDQDASYEELDAIIERRKQKSAEANAEKARENAEKEAAEKAAAEAAANQSDEQDPSDRDPEEDNGSTDETDPRSGS